MRAKLLRLCLTLCNPMDCRTPGFPVHHHLPELAQSQVHGVSDATHLILCLPLLLLPSIFPSIRVFSSKSALCIRWPKDWSLRVYRSQQTWKQRFSTSLVTGVKQLKMKVRCTIFRYKRAVLCVLSHPVACDSVTPQTAACQAPLSMGFSRQEHWSGSPFPPPRPNPGMRTASFLFTALADKSFTTKPPGEARKTATTIYCTVQEI